jgi:hypothetical protein
MTEPIDLDLNIDAPEELAPILRAAADQYRVFRADLQATCEDPKAGRVWSEFARILERAAESADRAVAKYV